MDGEVRGRRSQRERSAATRRKVIDAATLCIAEEGLRRATTTRVARRAGVTWGAIQHQFGDKDSILRAVMQRGLQELRSELCAVDPELPPRERIGAVVELTWQVFNRPFFRAFLDVALATRDGDAGPAGLAPLLEEMVGSLAALWAQLFPLDAHPAPRAVAAQRLAFHALSGMALEGLLRPGAPAPGDEIRLLEEMLYDLLAS